MDRFFYFLIVVNCFSFLLFGYDKYLAKHNKWRISEKNLILVSVLGGAFGSFLGMNFFRHKTKHQKFTIGVPFILALQIIAILLFAPKILP